MSIFTRRSFLSVAAVAGAVSASETIAQGDSLSWQPRQFEQPIPLQDLPTPALVLDADRLEANLRNMADFLKAKGVGLRPHTKTHKCPCLAKRQMELGAVGICCAKVSEAEVMAASGIDKILITSPVVTKEKIDRVIALASRAPGLQIVVDQVWNAKDLNHAAGAVGIRLGVVLDIDSGLGRTGIAPGEPAVELARAIAKLPHLVLGGAQCYGGHAMHVKRFDRRKARSLEFMNAALETRNRIQQEGIKLPVFSGGGTGTYNIDSALPGLTDLQCGSYPVMDVQYGILEDPDGRPMFDAFPSAMYVWSTAISQPVSNQITIDAGLKALYRDSPNHLVRDITGVTYDIGGDEHGILMLDSPSRPIEIGDKLAIIPAHCDPTINLYDRFHVCRNGQIEEIWPISARGMSQ